MRARLKIAGIVVTLLGFSSCGAPNVPLPPSLHLPTRVEDLRAVRKGDHVYLAWTAPERTTDHQAIHGATTVEICRSSLAMAMKECGVPVGTLAVPASSAANKKAIPTKGQENYADSLPAEALQTDPSAKLSYAISILNDHGRSAGLSNQVSVSAVRTLPPPSDFRVSMSGDGVLLSWTADSTEPRSYTHDLYRIYRAEKNAVAVVSGEVPIGESSFLDKNFEWEKNYVYRATVVTGAPGGDAGLQVEGDDTPEVAVFTHDIFPPAPPNGLQAVFTSGPAQAFIDLVWTPNQEPDLAGYNVYRRSPTGVADKLNSELLKIPAYRDEQIVPGAEYYYAIAAVDLRGNESARSDEAHELVP